MKRISKGFVFLFSVLLLANNVFAVTVATNIDGVVIKELQCHVGKYYGNLVNRTDKPLGLFDIAAKTFDKDGDPVGDCKIRLGGIDANSGMSIKLGECNCPYMKSVVFTITVDK